MGWQNFTGGVAALERTHDAEVPTRRTIPKPVLGPMISIIIPAHNEEAYLGQTLEGLQDQIYPNYEVIVVANGCTDRTCEIARHRCHRLLDVPERGLSRARNLGAEAARGDILVFLDADTVLDKNALERIASRFTREFAAGTLRGEPDIPRLKYQAMYAWKNLMHCSAMHEGSSGVILCWRDHFQDTSGFDEALHVRENSDLIRKLRRNGKYLYIGDAAVITSMRRYEQTGNLRTVWVWTKIWLQSLCGCLRNKNYEAFR
ncbi:MAG TPA: glycosyltransferase [Candidatus Saccharimonadales bacterium]|nr:glycosyltransferase [Candidatus Saccharimonadales bacterium]